MFGSGFRGFGGMGGEPSGMDEEKEPAKDVDNNSLYELLEVPKTATCEEIRRAFRRKALKQHPDKGGDPEKFKKLSEANEILNNPEKRDLYDKFGMEGVKAGGNPNASGFEDIFSFFGGGRRRDTGPKKAKPKLLSLQITLEQAYVGCLKTLKHKRLRVCEKCDGKGGKDVKTCTKCKGRKYIEKLVQLGPGMYSQSQQPCSECRATGEIMDEKDRCQECQGKKVIEKEKTLEVGIEAGVPHQHDYVFTGESDEYPGVMAGDVFVRINIKKHKIFERKGADLWMTKKITLLEALTGLNFQVTEPDGKKITIATAPGEIIAHKERKTVKGRGMPYYKDAMSHGNLYIQFQVEYPKKNVITPDKAKILRQILNVPPELKELQAKQSSVKQTGGKKKSKTETHFLEDFSESDLHKNPRGTNVGYREEEEDDEPRGGRGAQCQQQ